MTWLIIGLVLLAAFGPVLWLKPSKRDKRLTQLRTQARQAGLTVDIKPLPQLNPQSHERVSAGGRLRESNQLIACYSRTMVKPLQLVAGWRLHQLDPSTPTTRPSIEVAPGWFFDPQEVYPPCDGWPASKDIILPIIANLSEKILAVEIGSRSVGVYWSENAAATRLSVPNLASTLTTCEQAILELDRQLLANRDDENS